MTFMAANDLREELQATLDQMARVYAARDAAACAALFAEHASLYSPYAPPAHRRTEIEALHREWTQHATSKRFEILDFGGSGEIAWAVAKY
jgi:ketosteroid isomerase-like protein